jgi:hypothetical protein
VIRIRLQDAEKHVSFFVRFKKKRFKVQEGREKYGGDVIVLAGK